MFKPTRSRTYDYAWWVAFATVLVLLPARAGGEEPSSRATGVETDHAKSPNIAAVSPPSDAPPLVEYAGTAGSAQPNGESAPPESPITNETKPTEIPSGPPCTGTPGTPPGRPTCLQFNMGLQWWFVKEKGIFGPTMRLGGRWATGEVEWNLIRLWEESPALKSQWLGSIFGLYLSASPVHTRRVETHLGMGLEVHWLHGINAEELKAALGAKASIHWMLNESLGIFGSARTYLTQTEGLGLGETAGGARNFPVMLSMGIELRVPDEKPNKTAR